MERNIYFIGRACVAALFLPAGIAKFAGSQPFLIHMAAHGVPAGLLPIVATFEILLALALLTGFVLRPMAVAGGAFCLLTALVFHSNFADHVERTMFLKDIAIAGGLFAIFARRADSFYLQDGTSRPLAN